MNPRNVAIAPALANIAHPITRVEYERMIDAGLFRGERVELWRGFVVDMGPQKSAHAFAVQRLTDLLVVALVPSKLATVRVQLPLALSTDSEPEPDIAIVAWGDYRTKHPTAALVVVEVADSSLADDLGFKAAAYAEAGVFEYWVVDVRGRTIEVHTDPFEGAYRTVVTHDREASVAPGAFPGALIAVREIVG